MILTILLIPIHSFAQNDSADKVVSIVEDESGKINTDENVSGNVMSMGQIDKLIDGKYKYKDKNGKTFTRWRKEYTKALKELYKYIDKYPERYDAAEIRIRYILKKREKYSELFDELVAYSNEHPDDLEGCGKRVQEMEEIEEDPPAEIKDLMELFKQMYLYKYYDWKFHNAHRESSELTHDRKYTDAISKISDEFQTYEKEFYNDWENYPEIINEAEDILEELNANIADFNQCQQSFNENVENFKKLIENENFDQADLFYPEIEKDFQHLQTIQNNIVKCADEYEDLHEKLLKINPLITDASYLPFMRRFITGVSDYDDSGILGAIDFAWQDKLEELKYAISDKTRKIVDNYKKVLPDNIVEADDYGTLLDTSLFIEPITQYAELGCRVNDLTENFENWNDENYKKDIEYEYGMNFISGVAKQSEDVIALGEQLALETEVQQGLLYFFEANKGNNSFNQEDYLSSLFESLDRMQVILSDKKDLLVENHEWSKDYLSLDSEDVFISWYDFSGLSDYYVNQSFEHSDNTVIKVWESITGTYKENADIYADELLEYIRVADVFHKGFDESISEDDYERIKDDPQLLLEYARTHDSVSPENENLAKHYPELTLVLSEFILGKTKNNKESLEYAKKSFENVAVTYSDKDNVQVNNIIKDSNDYIAEKLNAIDNQDKETTEKYNSAKSDNEKVERIYVNVDRLLEEAERAFNQGDLILAKKLNEQAWSEETESWIIRSNPKRANNIENRYSVLNDKINDANNNKVIYETRALYNQARDEMLNEHYPEALNLITKAINLWAETHYDEKNIEFEDLLEIIKTALELQNGRTLEPSDPLYAEMSQLLSQANIYYDNGKRLISENKKDEAEIELQNARENLDKITKIYPLNQDVSYLRLMIDKLQMDPKTFEKHIKTRIDDAVKKAGKKETQGEALSELESLLKIDPDNKTLQKKIDDIKIASGSKEKEADNNAKKRASKLVQEARTLYNKRQYTQALSKIDEAIRLDRNNQEARSLRDTINIAKGANKTATVNTSTTKPSGSNTKPADTSNNNNVKAAELYRSANQYYISRSYDKAYRQILKIKDINPSYWNRSDVQTLYKNILRNLQ